ncbi:ThiF family adenylyltransferase [Exiguobacterium sp. s192]|uniref:HesA/MoeB/ThiF family protein n=1 Tax=Exiguobacterium sp. s192 TaxID=2751206 RepID=UPI001BE5CFF2|nr:ThiF family adenylyltransferase [Exiguobacterium sp. s192]
MNTNKVPTDSLLKGRRATEFIKEITLIDDLQWNESINKWILHCFLFSDKIEKFTLPQKTEWYILIDDEYPMGNISFFPAKTNSFTQTFPHQLFNGEGKEEYPWRDGLLCLDTNIRSLGFLIENIEPFEEDARLVWYVDRAIKWLIAASLNKLTGKDELFELVDFPENSALKIGFLENYQTFQYWNNIDTKFGIAEFSLILPGVFLIREFKKNNGQYLRTVKWGKYASQFKKIERILGSWILLDEMPYLKPWQAPSTWAELDQICYQQGVNLLELVKSLKKRQNHCNKIAHILLVGFPVKNKINGENSEIFWMGIEIPILFKFESVINRVKVKDKSIRSNFQTYHISKHQKINWMYSYNWSKEAVMSRGILPETITSSKILQIGAGSLGSSLSEILVRSGVGKLGIIDFDLLEMGNLTRHNLLLSDLGKSKVEALVHRLNQSSLHGEVVSFHGSIQTNLKHNEKELEKYNVILDCTGEDEVLTRLGNYQWSTPKKFISISLGFGGKRLFIFSCTGLSFQNEVFKKMINPWLIKEQNENKDEIFPREGLGCWHPLFPARIDDVWLMASTAVKNLESVYKNQNIAFLSVYEQQINNGNFEGIKLVKEEEFNG